MIQHDFSLKKHNTLRLDVSTKFFAEVRSVPELKTLLSSSICANNEILFLGGGSNIVFSDDYNGIVIKVGIKGREILREDEKAVYLEVGAGEDWPSLVDFTSSRGWGGIENLALVPGTAGAAPIQNIACYGHNLHETLVSVEALDIKENKIITISASECRLGYRTSIFKTEFSGRYVIVKILLRLQKQPSLNTSYTSRYESIEGELQKIATPPYKVRDVFQAVVNIRLRKLPRIDSIGTVGSVFKNPVITRAEYDNLRLLCPNIHCYPKDNLMYGIAGTGPENLDKSVKIPAAWLIDEMGWAGKRLGNCGVWQTQPLNLVNYGDATPSEYLAFMHLVKEAVYNRYSVCLEPEVVII